MVGTQYVVLVWSLFLITCIWVVYNKACSCDWPPKRHVPQWDWSVCSNSRHHSRSNNLGATIGRAFVITQGGRESPLQPLVYIGCSLPLILTYEITIFVIVVFACSCDRRSPIRHVLWWDWIVCSKYGECSRSSRECTQLGGVMWPLKEKKRIFPMTFYNYCISTLLLEYETAIFVDT